MAKISFTINIADPIMLGPYIMFALSKTDKHSVSVIFLGLAKFKKPYLKKSLKTLSHPPFPKLSITFCRHNSLSRIPIFHTTKVKMTAT